MIAAESVTKGHPDKICDQISDAVLDEVLAKDSNPENARVACECFCTTGAIVVGGEIRTDCYVDIESIARNVVREIGYTSSDMGFDADTCSVWNIVQKQSPDIAMGVDGDSLGAGDQGIMFGYATNETESMMPLPIDMARALSNRLTHARESGLLPYLRPDGKSQAAFDTDPDGRPTSLRSIVVSSQHSDEVESEQLRADVVEHVIRPVLDVYGFSEEGVDFYINPTGRFVIGGPHGDTGLTGRKIVVDQYGGACPVGGGAFCVDGDTEYMSAPGVWKKIRDYDGGAVAQWDDWKVEFVEPIEYVDRPAENMLRFLKGHSVDMVLSEHHDIVYETSKGNLRKAKAVDVSKQHFESKTGFKGRIPVAFEYAGSSGVDMTDAEIRIQVAYCADGSTKGGGGRRRIDVKKPHRIARLRALLEEAGLEYRESSDPSGFHRFYFKPPVNDKLLGNVFADASPHQMMVIADEVQKWDGDESKGVFRTTIESEADFVQFVFHAAYGKSASILVDDRRGRMRGGCETKSVLYEVYAKKNRYVGMKSSANAPMASIEPYECDRMYCFTVPSGMLLLRRGKKVFVTGNSGKDPSKVDRSAAYMARHVAKRIVAAGLADRCRIQLAYAIGIAAPVSIDVETFGTEHVDRSLLQREAAEFFDWTPSGIIRYLDLWKPVYRETAEKGHFGGGFSWESKNMGAWRESGA